MYEISLENVDKISIISNVKSSLNLPDYVSSNWDSLEEALADFVENAPTGTIISHICATSSDELRSYINICKDIEKEFSRKVEFDFRFI